MREIQENAVLLQGLRRQSNPDSAMRTLIMQAMAGLKQQEVGARKQSAMGGQPQPLLMLNPVLEKLSSVKEERPKLGLEGGQHVDKSMPASLGSRAIS